MPDALITVGAITGAHGIKGEVKVKSFTTDPAMIGDYGPFVTDRGEALAFRHLRQAGDHFIAAIAGVHDRNQAEALRGRELKVPRDRLPPPDDGETYVADLVGTVIAIAGEAAWGVVVGVVNYGAGDLLEVKAKDKSATVLIPYAEQFVVEEREGSMLIDLPEGYLDPA